MKQSLQLKLGQQLTMTPQLQQAIRLLQLSTLDLQQEIQQALDSNPLLEAEEEEENYPGESDPDSREESGGAGQDGPMDSQDAAGESSADADWDGNLPEELPVDTQWDDLLPSASAPMGASDDMPDSDFESRNTAGESLQEQLLWQLNLTRLSDTDRLIALAIIDATDALSLIHI